MKENQHGGRRAGSGRKPLHPEGATVTVSAKVPESLVASLDEYANGRGMNRSEAITEAIRVLVSASRVIRRELTEPE